MPAKKTKDTKFDEIFKCSKNIKRRDLQGYDPILGNKNKGYEQ